MIDRSELSFGPWLEKKQNSYDHRAVDTYEYKGFRVFISEGGPYHEKNPDFPKGWYETSYALFFKDPSTGKHIQFFMPLLFDYNHDMNLTDRRQARINSAKKAAEGHVNEFYKTWLISAPAILSS